MTYYSQEASNYLPSHGPGSMTTHYQNADGGYPQLPELEVAPGGWRPREVQGNETVQNQMTDGIDQNSRYIQLARQMAQQQANRQGRMFSGIASGQAERAAIQAYLPIAQQDAAWFGQTARDNMSAENEYLRQQAELANRMQISAASNSTQYGIAELNQRAAMEQLRAQQEFNREITLGERDWRTGERIGGQEFAAGQAGMDRDWRSGERVAGEEFKREGWRWQADQAGIERDWRTGERVSEQDWRAGESLADRDFRAGQSDIDRRYNRENLYFQWMDNWNARGQQMEANIWQNPNLTPQQQQAAATNFRAWWSAQQQTLERMWQSPMPDIFRWGG